MLFNAENPAGRGLLFNRINDIPPQNGASVMILNVKLLYTAFILISTSLILHSAASTIEVPEKYPTISAAIVNAKKGDTIRVGDGKYHEQIFVSPEITIVASSLFKAIIDGGGRGTVVTMGTRSTINGFEVKNGTIGIFSTANGVTVSQCRVIRNQQTGIMCVGNLPNIEDNLVIYNNGSGIQGWDVRTTSASINHNTVCYNGNHGISIGGNSSIIIENNIIAYNNQFGIKPSEETVRIQLLNNNFFQNAKFTNVLPNDNFMFNPVFINAQQLNFMLDKSSRCIGRSTDSQNIGARIVY